MAMTQKAQSATVCVLTAIFLFVSYIGVGFWACSELPFTTQALASAAINADNSPYTKDQLVSLASETRSFTVGDYGRSEYGAEGAADTLAGHVLDAAQEASGSGSPTEGLWSTQAVDALEDAETAASQMAAMDSLAETGQRYALDDDAVSHLNDVNAVLSVAFTPILGCVIIAAFLLLVSDRMFSSKTPGTAMMWAGGFVLGVLLILGVWAGLNFNGFFSALHSVFFAEGTWTFPVDSLLITMYPTQFWVGMGAVWIGVSALLAVLSLVAGIFMTRKASNL